MATIFNPDVLEAIEWDYDEVKLAKACPLFHQKMRMQTAMPGITLHNNLDLS